LERCYLSAGAWLARFHERVGGAHEEPLDKPRLRSLADSAFDALELAAARHLQTAPLRAALRNRIDALAAPWDRVAGLHGDFMSANILLTADERIAVLDTHRARSGSIYEDIARLATDLATLRLQVLSQGLAYRKCAVERCAGSLLRGYFGDRPPDHPLLSVHCALAVVRKWAFDEERLANARGLPPGADRALAALVGRFLRRQILEWLAR
jgi:hypothetical protein